MNTSLLQNQCCLLLQNHNRLPMLPPAIYVQNRMKMIKCKTITGNYPGTAHNVCNLLYRISKTGWKLTGVIHNLKGYDGHLIVKALKSEFGKRVGQLKCIDSFQFTPKGLDQLAKTLGDDEFRYLSESYTSNHFGFIRRKGVYDYMDSFDKSEETELPSQDAFFSKLSGSPCADSEYTHATQVCDAFRCKTMADYHDIYLKFDVLLLADFFEKFCRTCLEFYSLDPIHYYTTPGLACDAALRMSHVDL